MDDLSSLFDASGIQDSFCYRALREARGLASQLVGEDGKLKREEIKLKNSFYPSGFSDALIYERQEKFLARWLQDDAFFNSFKRFSLPLCHKGAEKLVRASVQLSIKESLTDAHVKKAAISAYLMILRQTVGSCFATAPAIVIQEEYGDLFIQDLYDLLTTGKLKRVIRGVEYSVPLSLSWGLGDLGRPLSQQAWVAPGLIRACEVAGLISEKLSLDEKCKKLQELMGDKKITVAQLLQSLAPPHLLQEAESAFKGMVDHALLKAWEFTLASLSEANRDFPRWNLSLSLGLDPEEKGGIGEILYRVLQEKLEEANKKVAEYHREAESALDECKVAQSLLKQSTSESEMRRRQAEYTARYHNFQSYADLRDHFQNVAKAISLLFSFLIKKYIEKIQEYFQEIYDPEMVELSGYQYEDSPAGFRLVYKHGRSDASLWTQIDSSDEFIRSLVDFFTMTEGQFVHDCETEEEKKVIVEATSHVILYVRSDEFLQRALERTKKQKRTPWSYSSGGTMDILLTLYFCRENSIAQESKWVESPLDLLTFLIDTIKNLSHLVTDPFLKNPHKRMLMHSPKHAFSLQPGRDLFKQGWQDSSFTYTWVRDHIVVPMQSFYAGMLLSPQEQEALLEKASISSRAHGTLQVSEFYQILVEKNVPNPDSFLYRSLPLTPKDGCKAALQLLLKPWTNKVELPESLPSYLSSEELCSLAKLNLAKQKFAHLDIHLLVIEQARALNLAPTPCLFADTNWPNNYFAFIVNPGTEELELWRTDRTGCTGYPMTAWKSWLDGTEKLPWVVYTSV